MPRVSEAPFETAHVSELDAVPVTDTLVWRPVRRRFDVRAFGINAYTAADAGDELVEDHNELGSGAGRHEELYFVAAGHATFAVAGEEIDAPAGTVVFVHDRAARREAIAIDDTTTVVAVGGEAGTIKPSAWEHFFAAEPAYAEGDYLRAIEIASVGLADHPDNVSLNYQLACYHALAGDREEALDFMQRAATTDAEKVREWAADDADLDSIRDDARFPV